VIESGGITESGKSWRTDVATRIVSEPGIENVMFEAADPDVFAWCVKSDGPEVNYLLRVLPVRRPQPDRPPGSAADRHPGTESLWGRVLTYKG
jgi:(2R)-phospho-3-sulfolactate synthase (ComA)